MKNLQRVGGLFTLLISCAALQVSGLPKWLNYLGILVGIVGILSTLPGLADLRGLFGMSQILWFVWLGIVLLRQRSGVLRVKEETVESFARA